MAKDYLYGEIVPQIVNVDYTGVDGTTAKVIIDSNTNRTIETQVKKVPHTLTITKDGIAHTFDGSADASIDFVTSTLEWGNITGTLSNQTDLQTALNAKENIANKLSSWQITPDNNHYPSEKLVKDECENIRAVAVGRCKSYVILTTLTLTDIKNDLRMYNYNAYKYNADGTKTDIKQSILDGDYDNLTMGNNLFDSTNSFVSIRTTDYIVSLEDSRTYGFIINAGGYKWDNLKIGDEFFVIKTNVPDRWFASDSSIYALETKSDLSNYYTKTQTDALFTTENNNIALAYNSSSSYVSGDYAMFNGVLKKYDGSAWNAIQVTNELNKGSYMPVINPPASQTLTTEEFNIFLTSGCVINGTFLDKNHPVFYPPAMVPGNYYMGYCVYANSSYRFIVHKYTLGADRYLSLNDSGTICLDTSGAQPTINTLSSYGLKLGSLSTKVSLGSSGGNANVYLYDKALPVFPSYPSNKQILTYKTDNTMSWEDMESLPTDPTTDGEYLLQDSIVSGTATKSWREANFVERMVAPTSTTLTDAQIAKIVKGVQIIGDFLAKNNPILTGWKDAGSYYYGSIIGSIGAGYPIIERIQINKNTKVISTTDNSYIIIEPNLEISGHNSVIIKNLKNINEKAFPAYPTSPTINKFLTYKTDNTLDWTDVSNKQDTLVSGTNIKTVNGNTLLGSGDITISGGSEVSITAQDTDKIGSITVNGTTYQNIPFSLDNTNYSIAIGTNAVGATGATTSRNVVLGYGATVNNGGNFSVLIGQGAQINSTYQSGVVVIGQSSSANTSYGTAVGFQSLANARYAVSLGAESRNYIANSVSFDGTSGAYNRTLQLYDPSKIFFRNSDISYSKTSFAQYTTGYTLAERLNGLALFDPSVTELKCDKEVVQSISANRAYSFETAPTSTGTNLSAQPEYKLRLYTSAQVTISFSDAFMYKMKTNNSNIVCNEAAGTIQLPANSQIGYEINIKCIGTGTGHYYYIIVYDWSI